jgi:LPS-assembly lipoprotein
MTLRHILFAATLLLSACGFHLAGTRPLPEPLQRVFIDAAQPYRVTEPPVEGTLRGLLQRRGGEVLGSADAGVTVIKLTNISETRQVLSIGTDNKVLEYQVVTTVHYQVSNGAKMLVPPDVLSLSRSYSYNPQTALAEEIKEARLRDYMQKELAELIMLRLDSALSPKADAPAAPPGATPAP